MVGCHKGGALVKLLHRCVCLLACLPAQSSQVQDIYGLPKRYLVGIVFHDLVKGRGKGKVVCGHLYRFLRALFWFPSFLICVLSCPVLSSFLVGSSPPMGWHL